MLLSGLHHSAVVLDIPSVSLFVPDMVVSCGYFLPRHRVVTSEDVGYPRHSPLDAIGPEAVIREIADV